MLDNLISLIIGGIRNPRKVPKYIFKRALKYHGPSIYLVSKFNLGENIFESEWDCLIILDTCRPDALEMVSTEYDFIDDISTRWSVGGDSWEWMANTFTLDYIEEIQDTAYYTTNPHAITTLENHFDSNHNQQTIEHGRVHRQKKWGRYELVSTDDFADYKCLHRSDDYIHNYPHPRSLTDKAIIEDRQADFDRMILHYMPPTLPILQKYLARNEQITKRKKLISLRIIVISIMMRI
jgi:hypothetical protein